MGVDGSGVLGNGASLSGWHWFRLVYWIDFGYFERLSSRNKCDGASDRCLRYAESSFKIPNVFVSSASRFGSSFSGHKPTLVSLARGHNRLHISN